MGTDGAAYLQDVSEKRQLSNSAGMHCVIKKTPGWSSTRFTPTGVFDNLPVALDLPILQPEEIGNFHFFSIIFTFVRELMIV